MAIKGLSKPVFGKYAYSQGAVSYSEGKTIGHAISYSAEVEVGDDNPLYGDNMIVEHDNGTFQTGTLTLETSEFTASESSWLLGITSTSYTVGEGTSSVTVTEYPFGDNTSPITVGFGIIELHQINDADTYKTVILPKCVPHIPADAATTKGESIDWQTKEIEFGIERSDESNHPWKVEAWHASEAAALAYLEDKLGVTAVSG